MNWIAHTFDIKNSARPENAERSTPKAFASRQPNAQHQNHPLSDRAAIAISKYVFESCASREKIKEYKLRMERTGTSDIEGKTARAAASKPGRRASFNQELRVSQNSHLSIRFFLDLDC